MKNLYFGIIIGVLGSIVLFLGWQFYSLSKIVSQDHTTIGNIVNFLNKSQQAQQPK